HRAQESVNSPVRCTTNSLGQSPCTCNGSKARTCGDASRAQCFRLVPLEVHLSSDTVRSSAATICHLPFRLIHVSVHTKRPCKGVPLLRTQDSVPCATAASP